MAEEKGVWRTIRGRRIFIAEGEDLATAMKKSGKFDNSKRHNVQTDKAWKKIDKLGKENEEIWKKTNGFDSNWYDENGKLTKEGEKLYNKREKNTEEIRDLQLHYTDYQPRVWEDDRYNNPVEYTGDKSKLIGKHIKQESKTPKERAREIDKANSKSNNTNDLWEENKAKNKVDKLKKEVADLRNKINEYKKMKV